MATEPRYSYDPVTQTYRLLTPQEQLQVEQRRGLGALYDAGGGADASPSAPSSGTGFNQGVSPVAQDIGLGLMGYSQALGGFAPGATVAGIAGNAIAGQQVDAIADSIANVAANQEAANNIGMATAMNAAGNTGTVSNQSITDAFDTANFGVTAAQNATQGLAAMNAQQAQQNQAQVNAAQAAEAIGTAVSEEADAAQDAANAADAAAAAAAASTSDGGGGGGGDAGGTAGVGDESGHSADGNNSGGGGGGGGDPDGNGTGEGGGWYRGGQIMRYNQGGIADAVKTQSMGRGPDTMLVHMSPKEVQGLQALAMAHGGSLTINPKTGLPEAGFLDSILPMVAGAALTGISGGLINPMTAGLLVGGGTALFTGDLGKGFMAGLGAFGGAGIGAGLSAAGAGATAPTVTGTVPGLAQAGVSGAQAAAAPVVQAAQAVTPSAISATGAASTTLGGVPYYAIPTETGMVMAPQAAGGAMPMFDIAGSVGQTPTLSNMGTGIQNLVTGAPGAGSNFMTAVGGPMGLAKYGGAAAAPLLSGGLSDEGEALPTKTQYIRPYKYDAGRQMDKEGFKYRTGAPGESTSELTYFTPTFTAQPVQTYKDYMSQNMAAGGIASMAKGRYLKGRGDGMSDDIPATIEGGQPARLADGEFVVPADVVSHLGNGSSNAGAKKLYKMMDRIRTARTGKTRQAPEVKTEKYMPA